MFLWNRSPSVPKSLTTFACTHLADRLPLECIGAIIVLHMGE